MLRRGERVLEALPQKGKQKPKVQTWHDVEKQPK
jgi:hypothetical protein